VFENRLLRRIVGPKGKEVAGGWRTLHNAELHNLYASPDTIRMVISMRMRWAGHVTRMRDTRNAYKIIVGKPVGNRPFGRPRRRWRWKGVEWMHLVHDRDQWRVVLKTVINLRFS
jgi:hypothetical protein